MFEHTLPHPSITVPASDIIPYLVARYNVMIGDTVYHQTFDTRMVTLPNTGQSGYIWPYRCWNSSPVNSQDFWFFLPGYIAPQQWLSRFERQQDKRRPRLKGDNDKLWEEKDHYVANGISFGIPLHPNRKSHKQLELWWQEIALHFLLLGGIDPDAFSIIVSDRELPHPLLWPLPRPFKTN